MLSIKERFTAWVDRQDNLLKGLVKDPGTDVADLRTRLTVLEARADKTPTTEAIRERSRTMPGVFARLALRSLTDASVIFGALRTAREYRGRLQRRGEPVMVGR